MAAAASRAAAAPGTLLAEGGGLLLAVPLWLWWAAWEGGYPPTVWIPGLVYLALGAVVLTAMAPRPPLRGARLAGVVALAATAMWSACSVLWAADKAMAWTGAGRSALALAAFALPAVWPPTRRATIVALAAAPLCAVAGLMAGLGAAWDDPAALLDGRLVDPAGYPNATAALLLAPAFCALALAAARELAAALRGVALAATGVLAAGSLLAQSRGAVGAGAAVLAVALVGGRLRLVAPVLLAGAAGAVALGPVLEVRRAALGGDATAAVHAAAAALVLVAAGLALVGTLYAMLDRRMAAVAPPRIARSARRAVVVLAVAGLPVAAVAAPTSGWMSQRAASVRTPDYERLERSPTRFTGDLGSYRVDYWRVALRVGAARPLIGVGAGNFGAAYLAQRKTPQAPLYAHSGWLESLATLGIPGLAATLAFALAIALGALAAVRRAGPADRMLRLAGVLPLGFLLVHGSVDWLTPFAGVVVPALGLAAAALAPWDASQ